MARGSADAGPLPGRTANRWRCSTSDTTTRPAGSSALPGDRADRVTFTRGAGEVIPGWEEALAERPPRPNPS